MMSGGYLLVALICGFCIALIVLEGRRTNRIEAEDRNRHRDLLAEIRREAQRQENQ